MTKQLLHLISASIIVLSLGTSIAVAQPTTSGIEVPPVPENLAVPPGHSVYLKGQGIGTQNYICMPTTNGGVTWKFLGPQATLFQMFKGEARQQITTHFLAANPAENGLARPSWQHSMDSSQVWGEVLRASSDPNYVEAGAIPWLLLRVAGAQLGPVGGAYLTQTTFIHRLNTSGGIAPSTGCSETANIGAMALVPYATDYFFYRAER